MLTSAKKAKLLNNLKIYSKRYLNKMTELDESGTRLMVNHFLTEVLGFIPIDEVKTEYMTKDGIMNKGLASLLSKTCALDPVNVAGLLFNPSVTNFIKRTLKNKFKSKFGDDEINASLKRIIHECIPFDSIKVEKAKKKK